MLRNIELSLIISIVAIISSITFSIITIYLNRHHASIAPINEGNLHVGISDLEPTGEKSVSYFKVKCYFLNTGNIPGAIRILKSELLLGDKNFEVIPKVKINKDSFINAQEINERYFVIKANELKEIIFKTENSSKIENSFSELKNLEKLERSITIEYYFYTKKFITWPWKLKLKKIKGKPDKIILKEIIIENAILN